MNFVKMHGLGNDFVLLDYYKQVPDLDFPELARVLCHRQFGVGGDGLVLLLSSEVADAKMRIFNPDGSEPEMCGNAIRCIARYVYDRGYVAHTPMRIETLAGILTLQLALDETREVQGVRVDMGEPILEPQLIPVLTQGVPVIAATLEVGGTA